MAEPARNLPHYDPEEPDDRPKLQSIQGGGESTPGRGNLSSVPTQYEEPGSAGGTAAGGRPSLKVLPGGGQTTPGKGKLSAVGSSGGETKKSGGALSAGQLGQAEAENKIGGLYKAAGLDQKGIGGEGGNKLMTRLKGINRRRKILAGAGIGGVAGLLLAVLVIAPLYRIPGLLNDLEDKIGAQVNDVVEARAERLIVGYLLSKAGISSTDYVYTGSPVSDLWRTFQSRRIEKQIFERTGIRFYKASDGKVYIEHDGRRLGNVRNYEEVMRLIDRGTIETKRDFKIITGSVLPAIRFHKASVEADSLKKRFLKGLSFGTPRPPPREEGQSDAEYTAKTVEVLTEQQIDQGTAGTIELIGDAFDCTMEGKNCESFDELDPQEGEVSDPNPDVAERSSDNKSSEELKKQINEAKQEAKQEAIKDRKGGYTNRIFEKILEKIVGAALAKTISAAIPYIGWIDFAATLQHALSEAIEHHIITRLPVLLRENAYGAIFTAWEGYAHQIMRGTMPLPMISALSEQIGGAEKAQGYKLVYGGREGGVKIDPPVGSNQEDTVGDLLDAAYNNFGNRYIVRGPLELWYHTIGKLLALVGDLGSQLVTWLYDVTGFDSLVGAGLRAAFGDNWKEEFAKFTMKSITWLFGITIDPLARGAQMFNNLFAGSAVALNYYCRANLGCRALTDAQQGLVGLEAQEKRREEMALMPMKDRLFSMDNPSSLTSTLIREAPADSRPGTITASIFRQVAQLPSSIMTALSSKARAGTVSQYSDAAQVIWYGALPTDLSRDIAVEVRQQEKPISEIECRKTKPGEDFNECMADVKVIQSLNCIVLPECPEWAGGQPSPESSQ